MFANSRLLNSLARVFEKFPTEEAALDIALQTLPLLASSLPLQAPPILTEVQMSSHGALSQFDFAYNPALIQPALKFVMILWTKYSSSLPASCNMKHLGQFITTALKPELGAASRVEEAIACGQVFVMSLLRVLSDSQILALEKEGVHKQLCMLLVHYDEMSAEELKQIVVGIGTFVEITSSSMEFLDEMSCLGLIQSALKYPTDETIQVLIWQLFTILTKFEKKFAERLFETGLLDSVLALLQKEGSLVQPPIRYLVMCCQVTPFCVRSCLNHKPLVTHVLSLLKEAPNETTTTTTTTTTQPHVAEDMLYVCDFLASLCKNEPASILDLNIVTHLEDYARVYPDIALIQACIAIEGLVNSCPSLSIAGLGKVSDSSLKEFSSQDHHLFFKDILSSPEVSSSPKYTKLMYITFQKLLKAFTTEALEKVHSKEFLEFYSLCFIRDTNAFPSLIARIVFTTHYFIFEMRKKDPITSLSDLSFHTTIGTLLQASVKPEDIATIMGLLACLVGKYYEFLKDVKPFLKSQVPNMLLDKAKVFGLAGRSVQFCDDFGRIMLNLTADKELSLELYEQGYLEQLVEMLPEKAMMDIRRSMIHAIGNIALGGQNIKQVLLDRHFYLTLLTILRSEKKTIDPFLISACCRVLHILASGDWAKRKFVECGCVEVLLDVMRERKENPEVRWRPLGLLSSLGFMAVTNRRYVLTNEVLEVVATILKESKNGKVISYTTLVFLGIDELDEGARRLRELGIGEHLQLAIDKPELRKQAPDLERWGMHVLEKQNLYTVATPSSCEDPVPPSSPNHISDWPPYIPLEDPVRTDADTNSSNADSTNTSVVRRLLPLTDSSFKPHSPIAPEITPSVASQLAQLGLDPNQPLFRIGRVYGSTHGLCSNCDRESTSEELVIRPLSMTVEQYQHLIDNGWYRRGGVKMFRLRYNHNMECCDWETRVLVEEFDHKVHKSYKKVLRRMPVDRLTVETVPASFNREAFDLYNSYHIKKHDKPLKSEHSYCEHVVNTPTTIQTVNGVECGTFHQLYRLDGELVAIGIIDIVPKGIVSIYMWYSVTKEISKYSFGVYSALKEIELVKELAKKNPTMKYYYLQGWNGNNKKLNYKANYEPEEFYCPCIVSGWASSLAGVSDAKKRVADKIGEAKKTDKDSEPMVVEGVDGEQPTQNDTTKEADAKDSNAKDPVSDKAPHIECTAVTLDKERFEQVTGQSKEEVGKIVVCLNYSRFMFLEDLFEQYQVGASQREVMETRFGEFLVAISPELRSQLVIDLMSSELAHLEN